MRYRVWVAVVILLSGLACNLSSGGDEAGQAQQRESGAEAADSIGVVSVVNQNVRRQSTPVGEFQQVQAGEKITTDATGHAFLNLFLGAEVELLPNTEVVVEPVQIAADGVTEVTLTQFAGETVNSVRIAAGAKSRYRLETPVAQLTVRGTVFAVRVDPVTKATHVEVREGEVLATIDRQQITIRAGEALDVDARRQISGPYPVPPTPGPSLTPTLTNTPLPPIVLPTVPAIMPTVPVIVITAAPTLTPLPTQPPPPIDTPTAALEPTALQQPLVASFYVQPEKGVAPLDVVFVDTSTGPGIIRWTWDFGDQTFATEQMPKHTYRAPGTYRVSLTVYDQSGQSSIAYGVVEVAAPPVR